MGPSTSRWTLLLLGLAMVAWIVRFIHATALSSAPVFAILLGDSKRYIEWASEIAAGDWLGTAVFYQAPFYPYVLAAAFTVFGVSIDLVRVLQALAGALACVLVAMAGRRFFDWKVGLAAGACLALYAPAIFFDGLIQKASVDLFLMAGVIFGAGEYVSSRRDRWPERGSVAFEQQDAVRLATEAIGRPLSPSEVSDYWLAKALDDIRREPAAWARLMGRKLRLAFNTVEAMDTESMEFHATYSPMLRTLSPLTFGLLLPLAVLGIAVTASHFRRLAVLYGIGIVFMGSIALFFVLARYRYPVVAVLVLFAAAGLVQLRTAWRLRRRQTVVGVGCAVAVALVVNRPMRTSPDDTYANFGTELLRLDQPREAMPFLLKAVELVPNDPTAHRDLALAHLKSGDAASAAREYTRVVQLEPHDGRQSSGYGGGVRSGRRPGGGGSALARSGPPEAIECATAFQTRRSVLAIGKAARGPKGV